MNFGLKEGTPFLGDKKIISLILIFFILTFCRKFVIAHLVIFFLAHLIKNYF